MKIGRKKNKKIFYKIQTKTSKKGKWKTPVIREWGIKTPNKFKSKFTAYRYSWKIAQGNNKIHDLRIIRYKNIRHKRR